MSKSSKGLALLLTLIVAMSCLSLVIVKPVNAQTATLTPSVPKFTLEIVDSIVGGGLQIEIQNQPIIPNGHDNAGIYYDLRYKWQESTSWYHSEPDPTIWERQYIEEVGTTGVTQMVGSINSYYQTLGNSTSQQLEMQIRVINGYQNTTYPWVPPIGLEPGNNPIIAVSSSDWSAAQIMTLPAYSVLPTSSSSPQPTSSSSSTSTSTSTTTSAASVSSPPTSFWLITSTISLIVIAVLLAVIIALVLYFKRREIINSDKML